METKTKTIQVIMLPTDKDSNLYYHNPTETLKYDNSKTDLVGIRDYQHLYIVSDAEIKEGDWFIANMDIKQCSYRDKDCVYFEKTNVNFIFFKDCKKIETTTDKSIHVGALDCNYLPQIPQSFIEAYVKSNGTIKEVQVEMSIICKNCSYTEDAHRFDICPNKLDHKHLDKKTNGYLEGNMRIKTRPDNTIIIHPSKTYTREQMLEIYAYGRYTATTLNEYEEINKYIDKL